MRHWSILTALSVVLAAPGAMAAPAKPKPAAPAKPKPAASPKLQPAKPQAVAFVATVDGVPVLKADYDRTVAMLKRRYQARFNMDFSSVRGQEVETELKANVLSHLVDRQVILNEGLRRKFAVTPAQVAAKVADFKAQAGSEQAFNDELAQGGMTFADLEAEIKAGIAVQAVADALAASVTLTEADVLAYYDGHPEEFSRPEEVRVRHILVKDKATAESLLAKLKGGADFAALAQAFSEDPGSKDEGGDVGFFGKGRMVPEFEQSAFSLKPGELSGLVRTQFGYHILQGVEQREARVVSFEDAKVELEDKLRQGARTRRLADWMEAQKPKAKVVYAPGYAPKPAASEAP